jgi:hydrogenase expression/formation protein HypC
MCLAVPVQVVSIEGNEAEVEIGGVKRRVSIALTPEVKAGDYVLLHTG